MLAVDAGSFIEHGESFGGPVDIFPMPHVLHPFRDIFTIYSFASHALRRVTYLLGLFYMIIQISLFPIARLVNGTLDRSLSEVDSADLVIAVGGNYLYSNRRLFNHLLILLYAKFLRRKKVLLLGHSIGPFRDKVSSFLMKKFLRYVDYVVFREEISSRYVTENIVDLKNRMVLGDLAFLIEPPKKQREEEAEYKVGVSIRKWFHNRPELFQRYIEAVKKQIISVIKMDLDVCVLPFSYLDGMEDDMEICRSILTDIPNELRGRASLVDLKGRAPKEIVELLHDLSIQLMLATRLHSAILASISNIPSLILSYQHFKAYGISRQLGLDEYVISLEDVRPETISLYFKSLFDRRTELKEGLQKNVERIRDDIYNYAEPLIRKLI